MRRTSHWVTDTHWYKLCATCKRWFVVVLKPPGTKVRSKLPTYCNKCKHEKPVSLKQQIKNSEKEDMDNLVSLFMEDCA